MRCAPTLQERTADQWQKAITSQKKAPLPPANWISPTFPGNGGSLENILEGVSPMLPRGGESNFARINGGDLKTTSHAEGGAIQFPPISRRG